MFGQFKFFGNYVLSEGSTGTLVWTSGDICPGFWKQVHPWLVCFFIWAQFRFTSDVTPDSWQPVLQPLGSSVRHRLSTPALNLIQRLHIVIDNHKSTRIFWSESYSPRQLQNISVLLLIRLQVVQQKMCIFTTIGLRHSLHLRIVTLFCAGYLCTRPS